MFTSASVFVRTPQGRISAFDTASTLPQALKVLLRDLDGKTPLHNVAQSYATWQTLANYIEQLIAAGLVEDKTPATLAAPERAAPLAPTQGWASTQPQSLHSFALPSLSLEALETKKVTQATDLMATFVLTHLPSQAMQLLKELEDLRTLGQLQASLPSYEILALSVGRTGQEHMARLRTFIQTPS
jgi:hypothetical protein